jgi:predicted nucleic acid-binding protein
MRLFLFKVRSNPVFAVFAVAVFSLVLVVWAFLPFFDRHEGTAAWVQAAGSLLIIVATAWISQRELVRAKVREEQAREEIRKSCAVLARNCLEAIDCVIQRLPRVLTSDYRGEFMRAYVPSDFELVIEELSAVPLHGLGHTAFITALLELRAVMGRIKRRLDLVLDDSVGRMSRDDLNSTLRTAAFNKVAS